MDLLSKENLAEFLEVSTDTIINILDNSEILDESGIPFGKIVSYVTGKLIEIKDVNKALSVAFFKTFHLSFIENISKHLTKLNIRNHGYNLIKDLKKTNFTVTEFNIDDIKNSNIYQEYCEVYKKVLRDVDIDDYLIAIYFYNLDILLKIRFFEIIKSNSKTFKILNDFLDSKSYEARKAIIKTDKFRLKQSSLILEKVFFNNSSNKLFYYIEPSFSICSLFYDGKQKEIEESILLEQRAIDKYNSFVEILTKHEKETTNKFEKSYPLFYNVNIANFTINYFLNQFAIDEIPLNIRKTDVKIVLLLGYPGQGKSTLCEKLVYDLNIENKLNRELILIRLRNIRNVKELIDNPKKTIQNYVLEDLGLKDSTIDLNNSLYILDGLDEIFMRDGLNLKDIDYFLKELCRITEGNSSIKIIITSRHGYVNLDQLKSESSLIVLKIETFSLREQILWFKTFVKLNESHSLSINKIIDYNENTLHKYISELLQIPFLLTLLSLLPSSIPDNLNKASLYDFIFKELIDRKYNNLQKSENISHITPIILRKLLREIAYSIFITGKKYIKKNDLLKRNQIKEILSLFNNTSFHDSLNGLLIAFYFKENIIKENVEKDDYAIEFLHQSLQEFMVAEYIVSELIDLISNIQNSDGEGETLLQFFNIIFSTNELSEEIQKYIQESIVNLMDNSKEMLKKVILKNFDYFVNRGFVSKDLSNDINPILVSRNTFRGIKLIMGKVNLFETDIVDYKIRKKFTNYFYLNFFED